MIQHDDEFATDLIYKQVIDCGCDNLILMRKVCIGLRNDKYNMSATTCTWAIAIEQTIDNLTAPTTKKTGYVNDMDKYFYDVGLVSESIAALCFWYRCLLQLERRFMSRHDFQMTVRMYKNKLSVK